MVAFNIIEFLENWAPPGAAWEKDNVGLQVGSKTLKVTNILLCLELTEKVLIESIKKKANFIFTHHPFLFKPLKNINTYSDAKGRLIEQLIKNDVTLYSAHTNLDFTKDGVSFELAKSLKLKNLQFLEQEKSNQFKLVVFVPVESFEKVAEELFNAGGGIIGEYTNCSFNINGIGTFKGSENSNPKVGTKQKFEKVNEVRLEILVDSWKLNKIVNVLKKVHPYEEPAFDIYQVQNENMNYGYGVIGTLNKSMTQNEFLFHVCKSLNISDLRYAKGSGKKIKTVAVCGGSGSDLLNVAVSKKADAFITADLKYHTFQDGEDKILFIDAGHYETEILSLNAVKRKLEEFIKINGESVNVFKYSGSTNPVRFFNNKRS
jgi:dinuclear metal center YbgI/SA1388 family protein